MDAPGSEPSLRDREAATLLTDEVGDRHPDVVERDLTVAMLVEVAEDRQVAHDGHAGSVAGHEDLRLLPVNRRVRVGFAHQDEELAARVGRATRPPLAA